MNACAAAGAATATSAPAIASGRRRWCSRLRAGRTRSGSHSVRSCSSEPPNLWAGRTSKPGYRSKISSRGRANALNLAPRPAEVLVEFPGIHRWLRARPSRGPHRRFRLRPGTPPAHRRRRGGALSTKEFELLFLLVPKRPGAVSKAEIQDAPWPRTTDAETSQTTTRQGASGQLGQEEREGPILHGARLRICVGGDGQPVVGRGRGSCGAQRKSGSIRRAHLGARAGTALTIDDASVSRRHASLSGTARGLPRGPRDKNGTFVKGVFASLTRRPQRTGTKSGWASFRSSTVRRVRRANRRRRRSPESRCQEFVPHSGSAPVDPKHKHRYVLFRAWRYETCGLERGVRSPPPSYVCRLSRYPRSRAPRSVVGAQDDGLMLGGLGGTPVCPLKDDISFRG